MVANVLYERAIETSGENLASLKLPTDPKAVRNLSLRFDTRRQPPQAKDMTYTKEGNREKRTPEAGINLNREALGSQCSCASVGATAEPREVRPQTGGVTRLRRGVGGRVKLR